MISIQEDEHPVDSLRSGLRSWLLSILFMLSGAAALIYQVAWGRAFTPIFGGTTRSASAVVSVVFLGMALGYWLGGKLSGTRADSLRRYAVVEFLIPVGALLTVGWLLLYRLAYPLFYESMATAPAALLLGQVVLAVLALGPPSVAMGLTLPLMAQAVTETLERAGYRVSSAYALNTLGATVGAGLAGFFLLEWAGTRGTIGIAALVNVFVGLVAWRLYRSAGPEGFGEEEGALSVPSEEINGFEPAPDRSGAITVVAVLSGFSTLALEVFFVRLLVNHTDGSNYSFAMILCLFLMSLALGSGLCALLIDRIRNPWKLIAVAGLVAAVSTFFIPLAFAETQHILKSISRTSGYWFAFSIISAGLMAPVVIAAGMILPAVWRVASRDLQSIGLQVGRVSAMNTVAGVAGSLLAGFFLLPWLGIVPGFGFLAFLYLSIASVGVYFSSSGWVRALALGAAVGVSCCLFLLEGWGITPLTLRENEEILFYEEGESGSVAVTRLPRGSLRLRVNDRYTLTSTVPTALRAQRSQSRLPLAFVDRPQSAAFIGVGGGISLSALSEFSSLKRILAIELIPGVLKAVPYFTVANRGIMNDPRVEVVPADGRSHLRGRKENFDVIVGDVFSPWHSGTGYLYTAEHFETVRDRLSPVGVYVQWLQPDQFSLEEIRIVVATFLDVFPEGEIWMTRMAGPVPLLGLVGQAAQHAGRRPQFRKSQSRFLKLLCGSESLVAWSQSAMRNTDDRPIVEYRSARTHLNQSRRGGMKVMDVLSSVCGISDSGEREGVTKNVGA